jgi:hypothetical protein
VTDVDRLRALIKGGVADEEPLFPPAEAIVRRGSARRARRVISAAMASLAVAGGLVWAGVGLWEVLGRAAAPAGAYGGNYRLTEIHVRPVVSHGTGRLVPYPVTVSFRVEWTSDTYPGAHRCTWRVFSRSRAPLGARSDVLVALQPGGTGTQTVRVSGSPASARASCDRRRLDVGDPYAYRLTDVRLISAGPPPVVRFTATWLGHGTPGVVQCEATLTEAGRVVAQEKFTYGAGESGPHQNTITLRSTWDSQTRRGEGSSPAVRCQPYRTPPSPRSPSPTPPGPSSAPAMPESLQPAAAATWEAVVARVPQADYVAFRVDQDLLIMRFRGPNLGQTVAVAVDSRTLQVQRARSSISWFDARPLVGSTLKGSTILRPRYVVGPVRVRDAATGHPAVQFLVFWIGPLRGEPPSTCVASIRPEAGRAVTRRVRLTPPRVEGARDGVVIQEFSTPTRVTDASVHCSPASAV